MKCVEIDHLCFGYDSKPIFEDLSLDMYTKKRYVLAGLNGCGKSTLMKIIGGKVLCNPGQVKILGKDPFRDTCVNRDVSFINNNWGTQTVAFSGYNMPLQSSLRVDEMMVKLKEQYPERNKELLEVLGINPTWRLNNVSEGQRKRVQLYLNLIQPFKVCLLDEITVNLDLLVKDRFMKYLKKETEERDCCILYVTHIFDGIDEWATDVIYMKKNQQIETIVASSIPNIYSFLLGRFSDEHDNTTTEQEEQISNENRRNAGGYSHGVLGDHMTLTTDI